MQFFHRSLHGADTRAAGRSLAPLLIAVLLLQVSSVSGRLAFALIRQRSAAASTAHEAASSRVLHWRRSVYDRAHDLHIGAQAPPLRLFTTAGRPVGWAGFRGKRVALLFADDGCACHAKALLAAWAGVQRQFPGSRVIFAVPKLDPDVQQAWNHAAGGTAGGVRLLVDRRAEVARHYNALWKPRAYAVDPAGAIAYVQSESTPDPDAPLAVGALWGGGQGQAAAPLAPRRAF